MKSKSIPPLIIAEIANAHLGKKSIAKDLVKAAADSGADAIKFQIFQADELLEKNHNKFELFKNLQFSEKEWIDIFRIARKNKLNIFADIFGIKSANFALKQKISTFKIHSSDVTNPILLEYFSKLNHRVLLSTAGCYPNEIEEAIKILQFRKKEIILMHGFQGYPTKINELNLKRIIKLENQYNLPVGIMDHLSGDSKMAKIIPLLAFGLGAKIIEKHITLDRGKKDVDYFSSLNPDEFKEFVSYVHNASEAMGTKDFVLSKNEMKYRKDHKKNPISVKSIKNGSKLTANNFSYKRTNEKNDSVPYFDFIGKVTSKNIEPGLILNSTMLKKHKKIAAIIACRVDSERLFGKPLQLIDNYSILHLLIKQLQTSKLLDDIVLAISDKSGNEVFHEFAKQNNIKSISGDDEDVLQRLIDGANYVNADQIFRVTSENPYLYWENIDKIILKHNSGNNDFTYVKDVPIGSGFEIINLDALKKSHLSGKRKHRSELCSLYIRENQKSFKIQSIIPPKKLQCPQIRLTVDTPEDLLVARLIHKSVGSKDNPIPLLNIINFLNSNAEISKINSGIPLGVTRIWP